MFHTVSLQFLGEESHCFSGIARFRVRCFFGLEDLLFRTKWTSVTSVRWFFSPPNIQQIEQGSSGTKTSSFALCGSNRHKTSRLPTDCTSVPPTFQQTVPTVSLKVHKIVPPSNCDGPSDRPPWCLLFTWPGAQTARTAPEPAPLALLYRCSAASSGHSCTRYRTRTRLYRSPKKKPETGSNNSQLTAWPGGCW